MRVGILTHGFANWAGGIDFLRMVASSLAHANPAIEFHALLATRGPRLAAHKLRRVVIETSKAVLGRKHRINAAPPKRHVIDMAATIESPVQIHEIDIGVGAVEAAARRLRLDVLLPSFTPLPAQFDIPWVGYVYDFQHRHLPHLFNAGECRARDQDFAAMLERAPAVIVNARAVAADIQRFHPDHRSTVFALPFSAAPLEEWLTVAPMESPERYFVICNQFWKHKDHATAFRAFARVAARHPELKLVCTGSTTDYRDPEYFPGLRNSLAVAGIADRVEILGMVAKKEQVAWVKGAVALIQPTLFEGGPGGGAIYDAVALGTPGIVSDIPVNRELDESTVSFFEAGNSEALAEQMERCLATSRSRTPDNSLLLTQGRARRMACGQQLQAAIRHVTA